VVAVKVGRTAESGRLAASHSGAQVGQDAAYEALFDRYGVVRAATIDQLAVTLMMLAQPHPVGDGGLASIHDSGGERALFVDLAAAAGVPFSALSGETTAVLEGELDPGLPAVNPLDAWGTGHRYAETFERCLVAMTADPATALGAVVCDRGPGGRIYPEYPRFARAATAATGKPCFIVSAHQGSGSCELALETTRRGNPVLDGMAQFLTGVGHLFAHRDACARAPMAPPLPPPGAVEKWRFRLAQGERPDEAGALAMLSDFGIPANRGETAEDTSAALAAAARIGYPVALKTAAPGLAHKTDVGGVVLGLMGPGGLAAAYEDMAGRLGPRVLVAPMAAPGVEMILGLVRDSQFGPVVTVGSGGIHAEALGDVAFALAPIDAAWARRMVDRLKLRALLEGGRGRPAADVAALCEAAARFSAMAAALGDLVAEMDVNPVVVHAAGCLAVDALVVARDDTAARARAGG
jgi:acyl-CoA synthetase (NDP forming)